MEKGVHKLWRASLKTRYVTKPNAAIGHQMSFSIRREVKLPPKLLSSILPEHTMNQQS